MDWIAALLRWFHELAGIVWFGLHYYLDFFSRGGANAARVAQSLQTAAIVAWLLGCALLSTLSIPGHHGFVEAFMLRGIYAPIGIGAWLGTIMLAVTLGPMRSSDAQTAAAWTRVNTVLSVPLIFFMAFGYSHQGIAGL